MHQWRGGAHARMAEMGKLTGECLEEGGEAVPQRCARRGSGGFSGEAALRRLQRAQGFGGAVRARRREGKVVRGRRRLPRSPIYRGGVVTAPVTTPPGSPPSRKLCGLRVAVPAHV